MQVNSTQAIRQYSATVQSAKAAESVEAAGSVTEEKVSQAAESTTPSTDRVELSKDASSVWKMSESDRADLVKSLKADQQNQMDRFISMMTGMFQKQGITAATAEGDSIWKMFASGNFTVDADTKAAAQEAISENGYWGVKQTSERIFSMAAALAGDDVEKMQKMQAAVEKGFKQAGIAWGGKLPSITDDTHAAINKMFDDYYASRKAESSDKTDSKTDSKTEETKPAESESEDD